MAGLTAAVLLLMATATVILGVSNTQIRRESAEKQAAFRRAESEAATATAISNLLQNALESANPDAAKGSDYTVRQLLDDISSNLDEELHDRPEAEAALRATIGNAYRRLQMLEKAEPQLREALEIRKRVFGAEHPLVAQSMLHYAWYLKRKSRNSEAEQLLRQALAIHKAQKIENSDTMGIRTLLHFALMDLQRYEDAEVVFQEASAIASRQEVPDGQFAILLSHAGAAANSLGDPTKSERLCRQSIELQREVHGETHPEFGWALNELGNALLAQNKLAEAETSYRNAIEIFRKNFGNGYPGIGHAWDAVAHILSVRGDQEAIDAWNDDIYALVKMQLQGEGDIFPSFGHTFRRLAFRLPMAGNDIRRKEEAFEAAVRVFAEAAKKDPGDHAAWLFMGDTLFHKGRIYEHTGRLVEAEAAFRRAIDLYDEHAEHFDKPINAERASHCLGLASFLASTGRSSSMEVRELIEKAYEISITDAVAMDAMARWLTTTMVLSLRSPQKAVELAQRAVAVTPDSGLYWNTLGIAQYRAGQFQEAVISLDKSIQLGFSKPMNWLFLAMAKWQLNDSQNAYDLYGQAVEWMDRNTSMTNDQFDQTRDEAASLLGKSVMVELQSSD